MGILTEGERLSSIWVKLRDRLEDRLGEARAKLEAPGVNTDQGNILRGRILELKELMALGHDDPTIESSMEF